MTDTTTTRRPLTATTWDDYRTTGYRADDRAGWAAAADLAHELVAATHLTIGQARLLVGLIGQPVVMEWDTPLGGGRVETKRTTVLVDQVFPPSVVRPESCPGSVRVRYTGFGHGVPLSRVRDVAAVGCSVSFRYVGD